jgi:TonB-dependent SusC/RagA subfamily outer membrane receptor
MDYPGNLKNRFTIARGDFHSIFYYRSEIISLTLSCRKSVNMKTKILLISLLSLAFFYDIPAQNSIKKVTITGRVTDLNNNPVPGAIIMIDGTNTNTKTNDKGHYKIKVNPTASRIGVFTTVTGVKEEPVNRRQVVDFSLDKVVNLKSDPEYGSVNEDLVNAGYGVTKKGNLTKPVTRSDVSGREYSSFSSIYEVLRTVPDVMVSGTDVTIRGVGTTGSRTPLFVVNGIAVSSVSSINPSMVKSIEVLKGPSASIYGMQGANGVILIHLK